MDSISEMAEGRIVAAQTEIDGQQYAIVAVDHSIVQDRILAARTLAQYSNRLFGELPAILAAKDSLGRIRFVGGGVAPARLEAIAPFLVWRTLFEDASEQAS